MIPIAAAALAAAAQPGDIVVTGRGLEAGRGETVYDAVVIGRERLDHSPSTRLEEVLRDVPGLQLFRRSDSRSANPTSQGVTLRALGGNASSRALVLLDGVPQSDPFGGWIGWTAFDPRRLGLVRVVRGGGSGVHGPGALAGTIELTSAGPDELEGPFASAAYGSRESIDAFAGVGARLGDGFVTASASWARGDGFVPVIEEQRGPADRPAPYRQASVAVRAAAPVTASTELQASLLGFTDARERGTAFSGIGNDGADASLRLVGSGRLPFSLLGYVQVRQFSTSFASVDEDRTEARRVADQYNVPSTGLGARAEMRPLTGATELRLGADWRAVEGRSRERYFFIGGEPTRAREAGGRSQTIGAFAELAQESNALTLTAGGRLDHWRIEEGFLRERILAAGASLTDAAFPARSGWEPTARAGVAWRPAGAVTLRGAAYLGWRLPTLNELYRPFRVGVDATAANAFLEPERLKGAELGAEWRPLTMAQIGVTLFANRLDNAIANVSLGQGPGVFPGVGFVAGEFNQRRNLDAVVSRGVEVDGRVAIGRWSLSAGYAFADAEVRASGPAAPLDGLRPAQTPRHSAAAKLAWSGSGGAYASFGARYGGSRFEDDLNRQRLASALSFDAFASLPLTGGIAVVARAENLTGERVVAGISGGGIVERATPRTLWLGLRWTG